MTTQQGSVPTEVHEKLQAASKDFAAVKCSREAFDKFAVEAKGLLAGHDEALRLVEKTILKSPEVWEKMHEYMVSQKQQVDVEESGKCSEGGECPNQRSFTWVLFSIIRGVFHGITSICLFRARFNCCAIFSFYLC